MQKLLLDQYLLSNHRKKNGFTTELRREQQFISQSTQPPSRALQLRAFLNHSYLAAPSGFPFHEPQDEETSASCYSRTCNTELQSQTRIHLLVKQQPSEKNECSVIIQLDKTGKAQLFTISVCYTSIYLPSL